MPLQHGRLYEFGQFRLDTVSRRLLDDGRIVTLTPKVFDLLVVLVASQGRILGKDELMKTVWPDTFVEEGNLTQNISVLRKALSAGGADYIETIPKQGYRFAAPVTELESVSKHGFPVRRRFAASWIFAAAALALLVALAIWNPGGWRDRLRAQPGVEHIRSLAVLPLENFSGDPSQDYLADSMTDELITELAAIRSLRVTSRTSVMRFKGTHTPAQQIARDLNVDAIVEGSVVRSGENLRITAQLVQASSDRHLWAHTYDGSLRDILTLEREAALAIAREISIQLSPQEKTRLANARPTNAEATDAYFQGRYYWNTRRTKDGLRKAIGYFEAAVAKDPNYAPAYSGIADSYVLLGFRGFLAPQEAYGRAKAAAIKALALDNTLAEAHAAPAFAGLFYDWAWSDAERQFRRAIELNPSYSNAHHWFSHYLIAMHRFEESLAESKTYLALDPLEPGTRVHLGEHYLYAGEYDRAIEQLLAGIQMDPSRYRAHDNLGRAYEQKRMYPEALAEFERAVATSQQGGALIASQAAGFAAAGRRNDALRIVNSLKQRSGSDYVSAYAIAEIYAVLGDKDQAFAWLEKAYEERSSLLAYIQVEPRLDKLRADPRFQSLLHRLGL